MRHPTKSEIQWGLLLFGKSLIYIGIIAVVIGVTVLILEFVK
jgi:hypothetical protein